MKKKHLKFIKWYKKHISTNYDKQWWIHLKNMTTGLKED